MTIKRLLLGSTALIGAGLLGLGGASAAEIKPIGALDIGIGGFMRYYAFYGNIGGKIQTRNVSDIDQRTDTEIFFYATGKDEATGLDYGARVELEADTSTGSDDSTTGANRDANSDEAFAWIRGTFGEFRFGDEDGGSDLQKVGAFTFAAFSGGIDGVGPIDMGSTIAGTNSGDATKIVYITPTIAGFNGIVSYANNAQDPGDDGDQVSSSITNGAVNDLFEAGVAYRGTFGSFGVLTSIIGHYGHFNASNPPNGTNRGQAGEDGTYKLYGGLNLSFAGITVGGGYGWGQGMAPNASGGVGFNRGAEMQWANLGIGGKVGPANLSLTYGQVLANKNPQPSAAGRTTKSSREPWEVVLSADVGIAPGLVVGGEVAYFNTSGGGVSEGGAGVEDTGVLGLVGVRVAF